MPKFNSYSRVSEASSWGLIGLFLLTLSACPQTLQGQAVEAPSASAAQAAATPDKVATAGASQVKAWTSQPKLARAEFNRLVSLEAVPIHWLDGALEPGNLVEFATGALAKYVDDKGFLPAFDALYGDLVNRRRIEAVQRELNSGRVTAVVTDLRAASPADKALVRRMAKVAARIEAIYAKQNGRAAIAQNPVDSESRELLRRSQGFWCQGPQTRDDPLCHGLSSFAPRRSDAYPADLEQDGAFCEQLRKNPNASALMNPFAVVRRRGETLVAVSYLEVYGEDMRAIADELELAAQEQGDDEKALKNYLLAAAQGFRSNNWDAADEAWVKMNSRNSRWYLRVGPDEVYTDPCNAKAGFHLSFARINPTLAAWTQKLSPLRQEMETRLAAHIGAPYKARQVVFALPDFIDIVLNAGDSRDAFGATVGQSLPNWGPVSARGDGRTVVMTNLYAGPDSKAVARAKAQLLLDPNSLKPLIDDDIAHLLDVLLHEATHNLGPHSDYQIDGKPPREVFGGLTSSILEELKAQTGALWFVELLQKKGIIDQALAEASLTQSILWCFGQMSRGLFDSDGKAQVYPTLAAIQVGYFLEHGGLRFDPEANPDGGADKGRFVIDLPALQRSADSLMQLVGAIKAKGDKAGAEALIATYTSAQGQTKIHQALVQERGLRFPKESFSYAIRY